MENLELAKYWYYRHIDNFSEKNIKKDQKLDWQINKLEMYLKDSPFNVKNGLCIKDKVILRLRAASYYGVDFADYIKDLKTGVFKLIWDKEPDRLTWDEYFDKNPTNDKEIDYAAHKRTRPYDSNAFYSQVESDGKRRKKGRIGEYYFNRKLRGIHLVKNKNLEIIDRKISAEVFANSYTFYYESKGTGTIRTKQNQEILDDLELLLKKIEPSLKKEFEKFLLSIGIDFKNAFPFKDLPKQEPIEPHVSESKKDSSHFPLLDFKDLQWQDIKFELVSDDSIRLAIQEKKYSKHFLYSELEMIDRRKGDLPNILWKLMKQLSINNGLLDGLSFSGRGKLEKTISRLRVHLRRIFGLDGNPIPFNRINTSYKTKFSIIDKRPNISQSHIEKIESSLISKSDTYEKPDY